MCVIILMYRHISPICTYLSTIIYVYYDMGIKKVSANLTAGTDETNKPQ